LAEANKSAVAWKPGPLPKNRGPAPLNNDLRRPLIPKSQRLQDRAFLSKCACFLFAGGELAEHEVARQDF
jgi:hypothetical protein